jgi:hypothetical protein
VSKVEEDLGTEIVTLRAELRKLPAHLRVLAGGDRFHELKRLLDQRFALLRMTEARRAELSREKTWILSEVAGYERGLVLVGGRRAGRLQRRADERAEEAARVAAEAEEVDGRIESIESDILALQVEMAEILRRSVADSEEKVRRAAHARRQRQARQLGDVGRNAMWSPVAVMGYRAWQWTEQGFHGVRQPWLSPRMSAVCSAGDGLPHTDGRCAEVAYGCGIYAAKSLDTLLNEIRIARGVRVAVGLVGLEGKVVEHERGYRAEIATIQALALLNRNGLHVVAGVDRLSALFADPSGVSRVASASLPLAGASEETALMIRDFLEQHARRNQLWT